MSVYRGEVVYICAFDVAYDMKREPVEKIFSIETKEYSILPSKRSPKRMFFYRPRTVTLPAEIREGQKGRIEIRRSVKLFNVGAISIKFHIPFEVERLEELVGYHNMNFAAEGLEEEIRELAEKVKLEVEPYCIRPLQKLNQSEDYTVFCLYELPEEIGGSGKNAEDWLMDNRRAVAAILTEEEDAERLSEQEATESTEQYLSYYDSDLAVVDWDAALVIGKRGETDDILHIMEMANVQLVELSAYDRILDESLEQAYRDLTRHKAHSEVHRNLREIRVDLARLSDELSNITKFFGDWHVAKIYGNVSSRFHLADWQYTIDEKLKTLDELYHIIQQERVNSWMVALEIAIVVLFVIDVIILLLRV
jgi:hypothetical protein